MANIDFAIVFDKLKDEVLSLALTTFKSYGKAAKSDAIKLLDDLQDNLKTWTLQLASGELSIEDYEFLVLGQKEVIKMSALKQVGISVIKADEFKNSLFDLIIKSVLKLI